MTRLGRSSRPHPQGPLGDSGKHAPTRRWRTLLALSAVLVTTLLIVLTATVGSVPATAGPEAATSSVGSVTVTSARHSTGPAQATKPTIVLVHGAFADSSGWSSVIGRLQTAGYPVIAFSNPLRGPRSDGEYLRQVLSTIQGPVVLVGHSHGGAVITNGATGNPNLKALVLHRCLRPRRRGNVSAANELGGGHTDLASHLIVRPYPGAAAGDGDGYIDPDYYRELFAQDFPKRVTRVMAATQRPAPFGALLITSGPPAWKTIPSWYLVANDVHTISPKAERVKAARAGATTVSINSSHVAMISQPNTVSRLILRAARCTSRSVSVTSAVTEYEVRWQTRRYLILTRSTT